MAYITTAELIQWADAMEDRISHLPAEEGTPGGVSSVVSEFRERLGRIHDAIGPPGELSRLAQELEELDRAVSTFEAGYRSPAQQLGDVTKDRGPVRLAPAVFGEAASGRFADDYAVLDILAPDVGEARVVEVKAEFKAKNLRVPSLTEFKKPDQFLFYRPTKAGPGTLIDFNGHTYIREDILKLADPRIIKRLEKSRELSPSWGLYAALFFFSDENWDYFIESGDFRDFILAKLNNHYAFLEYACRNPIQDESRILRVIQLIDFFAYPYPTLSRMVPIEGNPSYELSLRNLPLFLKKIDRITDSPLYLDESPDDSAVRREDMWLDLFMSTEDDDFVYDMGGGNGNFDPAKISAELVNGLLAIVGGADHVQAGFAVEFFDAHLKEIIAAGKFTKAHVDRLVDKMAKGGPCYPVYEFFRKTLTRLIRAGLFNRDHIITLKYGFDPFLFFFANHLPELINRGIFDADHVLIALYHLLASSFDWEKALSPEEHRGKKPDLQKPNAKMLFFEYYLPQLLKKKLFTRDHIAKILEELKDGHDPDRRAMAISFLNRHFQKLWEAGLLDRGNFSEVIEPYLRRSNGVERRLALKFLGLHLTFLIEHDILPEGMPPAKDLEEGMPEASDVYADNISPLLHRRLVTPTDAGRLAYDIPKSFIDHFHTLKALGLVSAETVKAVIERSHFFQPMTDGMRNLLEKLAFSKELMASQMRWEKFLALFSRTKPPYGAVTRLFDFIGEAEKAGAPASTPEEALSLVIALADMDFEEQLRLASLNIGLPGEKESLRARLQELILGYFHKIAEQTGVQKDKRYLKVQALLDSSAKDCLFFHWYLMDMEHVWADYAIRLQFEGEVERRAIRNSFLNFLEQQVKSPPPSYARLFAKAARPILENVTHFMVSAGWEAPKNEQERLETFLTESKTGKSFLQSPLFGLLNKATRFMEPKGIAAIRRLLLGLQEGTVAVVNQKLQDGQMAETTSARKALVYPRYDELKGAVSDEFLEKWMKDYEINFFHTQEKWGGSDKKILKDQLLSEVGGKLGGMVNPKAPKEIRGLLLQMIAWHTNFERSEELEGQYLEEARRFHSLFEAYYQQIAQHIGPEFAGIRSDLRNYFYGINKGIRRPVQNERIVISGDLVTLGRVGSTPVDTCLSLEFPWDENLDGKPVQRLLHGQFKVANWEMDGSVAARFLLEVTVDSRGHEHLLVERLYPSGGFGRIREFRLMIAEHARHLGIPAERVHFAGSSMTFLAPPAIATGDSAYHESFQEGRFTFEKLRLLRERGFPQALADIFSRIILRRQDGLVVAEYPEPGLFKRDDEALLKEAGVDLIAIPSGKNPARLEPLSKLGFTLKPDEVIWTAPAASLAFFDKLPSLRDFLPLEEGELSSKAFQEWYEIFRQNMAEKSDEKLGAPLNENWFERMQGLEGIRSGKAKLMQIFVRHPPTNELIAGAILLDAEDTLSIVSLAVKKEYYDQGLEETGLIACAMQMAADIGVSRLAFHAEANHFGVHADLPAFLQKLDWGFGLAPGNPYNLVALKAISPKAFENPVFYLEKIPAPAEGEAKWQVTVRYGADMPESGMKQLAKRLPTLGSLSGPHEKPAALEKRVVLKTEHGIKVAEYEAPYLFHPEDERELIETEKADLIRIRGANGQFGEEKEYLKALGYAFKPVKLVSGMPVAESEEAYLAKFGAKKRETLKRKLKKSADIIVETGPLLEEDFEEFLPVYLKRVGEMPRGQAHLDAAWYEKQKKAGIEHKKIFLRDQASRKLLGGTILYEEEDKLAIGFLASLTEHREKNLDTRIVFELMRQARALGFKFVGYGTDLNLFGHHETIGLFQWKQGFGFKLTEEALAGREAIKIINPGAFMKSIFYLDTSQSGNPQWVLLEGHELTAEEIARMEREGKFQIQIRPVPPKTEGEEPPAESALRWRPSKIEAPKLARRPAHVVGAGSPRPQLRANEGAETAPLQGTSASPHETPKTYADLLRAIELDPSQLHGFLEIHTRLSMVCNRKENPPLERLLAEFGFLQMLWKHSPKMFGLLFSDRDTLMADFIRHRFPEKETGNPSVSTFLWYRLVVRREKRVERQAALRDALERERRVYEEIVFRRLREERGK